MFAELWSLQDKKTYTSVCKVGPFLANGLSLLGM